MPNAVPLESSMPCHDGVSHTSGNSHPGSWLTGKNAPVKSIIGIITNRKMVVKLSGLSNLELYATNGALNASAANVANGTASTIPGPVAAPRTTAITTNTVARANICTPIHNICPYKT